MDIVVVLNNSGAIITLGLGLLALVRPSAAAAITSIRPEGLLGVSEIRATYGGLFAALGIIALYSQSTDVFGVVGFAWTGAAMGRLASVAVDKSTSPKNIAGMFFELAVGLLLLFR